MSDDDNDLQPEVLQRDRDGDRPTTGTVGKIVNSIRDRFLNGKREGRTASPWGRSLGKDTLGSRGNLLDGKKIGPVEIRRNTGDGRPGIVPGAEIRNGYDILGAVSDQYDATKDGLARRRDRMRDRDDSRPQQGSNYYDPNQPYVTKAPQHNYVSGRKDERPTGELKDNPENSQFEPDQRSLARIDDAQGKLNNGPLKDMNDETAVGHVTKKMKAENPGAYELYTQGGFAQTKAGLNEFFNYSREVNQNPAMRMLDETFKNKPDIGRAVLDKWRQEVGADSTSPNYKGGKTTILDRLGEMAQDPDKLDALQSSPNKHEFWNNVGGGYEKQENATASGPAVTTQTSGIKVIDPNDAISVQTSSGQVNIPKSNPSEAKFEPVKPATQIAGLEIKTGEPMTAAMLNKLSAQGILPEVRAGQEGNASTNLFVDRGGKIVGGYTSDAKGVSQNFVSRDDLTKQLADMGKDIGKMEQGIQMARSTTGQGNDVKVAATNVPSEQLTKENNIALNVSSPAVAPVKLG